MLVTFTQKGRSLRFNSVLGPDVLLLEQLEGTEAVSELFSFRLDLLMDFSSYSLQNDQQPLFQTLVGSSASVEFAAHNFTGDDDPRRVVRGIVSRVEQRDVVAGPKGPNTFIRFRVELVPQLWLLTRRTQNRVFQQQSVSDILEQILGTEWQLPVEFKLSSVYQNSGPSQERNYCVQYQETDFALVSRLMEDEGLLYYFAERDQETTLVISDPAAGMGEALDPGTIRYSREEALVGTSAIRSWHKAQEVRSSKVVLWDSHFQMTGNNFEAVERIPREVSIGKVTHKLDQQVTVNGVDLLTTFDYPAGFTHRFDGIDKQGAASASSLGTHLFEDNARTAKLRAQEEASRAIEIGGTSDAAHLFPGGTFQLTGHFDGDDTFLVTRVKHLASTSAYTSGATSSDRPIYRNEFTCVPAVLRYRPARTTPRPRIVGPQTAVVVGPVPKDVNVDKFGRVKVRFPWDPSKAKDGNNSCWIRVGQVWAGDGWGAFFWPRVGHEVIVAFEEGDPDRPLIVGSVYNDVNSVPNELPDNKMRAGFRSCSMLADPKQHFNQVVFHDEPDGEHVEIHSETQEIITSRSMKVSNTPGPSISLSGSFLFPIGSGTGGGVTHDSWPLADLGSGSGGGGFGDLMTIVSASLPKGAPGNFTELFPGKTDFCLGNNLGVTMAGNRYTHIIAGFEAKTTIDIESLIDALLPLPVPGLNLGFGALTLLLGMRGVVDLNIGPKFAVQYVGPKIDIHRGPKYGIERKSPLKGKGDTVLDTVAIATGALVFVMHIVGDLVALLEFGYNGTQNTKVPPLALATILPTALTNRAQAFMNLFETMLAVAATVKKDAEAALKSAKEAVTDATISVQLATAYLASAYSASSSVRTVLGIKWRANFELQKAKDNLARTTRALAKAEAEVQRLGSYIKK
jgi:type VI secretion system secreted protein VgrG